jgi:PAS domain S-box-containing protein
MRAVKNEANQGRDSLPKCGDGIPSHELQEREYFRQIADNLQEVFAVANADLSKFLYVNRSYLDIWGRTLENLYANPRSFLDSVHKDDRESLEQALEGLIEGKPIIDHECRVIRPDGAIAWLPAQEIMTQPFRWWADNQCFSPKAVILPFLSCSTPCVITMASTSVSQTCNSGRKWKFSGMATRKCSSMAT